jgi:integrase
MPNEAIVLTDAKIKALRPPASGQAEIIDKAVPGLRVRIGVSGAKSFVLRKRVAGKYRNITLGRYSERLTLADARKKARTLLSDIEIKADPITAIPQPRKRMPSGYTVRALWPDYKRAKADRRSIREIERVFNRHILPEFGDRAADGITRAEITTFIDDIAGRSPVMARNVLAYFSSFYGWALPRLDRLPGNPCRDAGRPAAPKARDRVLSHAEVGVLWGVLETEGPPFGPAIQLLMLTGQRRNEVFNADRAEFDLERALWTIPRERAKNGVTHLVPLSALALSIVKSLLADHKSDKLIPARGNWDVGPSGFSKAIARLRDGLAERVNDTVPHWTLHDLRRTLATGMQRLGVRLEVTEAVLNHVSGTRSGIVGVYQRHNFLAEKREALKLWEGEVMRFVLAARRATSTRRRRPHPSKDV